MYCNHFRLKGAVSLICLHGKVDIQYPTPYHIGRLIFCVSSKYNLPASSVPIVRFKTFPKEKNLLKISLEVQNLIKNPSFLHKNTVTPSMSTAFQYQVTTIPKAIEKSAIKT